MRMSIEEQAGRVAAEEAAETAEAHALAHAADERAKAGTGLRVGKKTRAAYQVARELGPGATAIDVVEVCFRRGQLLCPNVAEVAMRLAHGVYGRRWRRQVVERVVLEIGAANLTHTAVAAAVRAAGCPPVSRSMVYYVTSRLGLSILKRPKKRQRSEELRLKYEAVFDDYLTLPRNATRLKNGLTEALCRRHGLSSCSVLRIVREELVYYRRLLAEVPK